MKNLTVLPGPGLPGFPKIKLTLYRSNLLLIFWLSFLAFSTALAENVITSGTTLKVSSGTSVVSLENLVVKSGATLWNEGTVILKKDFTNENAAPNSLGTGTITCSGTSIQTIAGQNIIQNFTVSNSSGIIVGGNTTVNGVLTLTSGRVALGSNNLLLGPSATISGTPSASLMIVVTGSGELRKEFPAAFTGSFTFPVGDDTGTPEYSPVTLTFSGGTFPAGNYVGITLVNNKYPDPNITGNFLNRYWTITRSGISNFTCNAAFRYLSADVTGNEDQISCTKVNPLPWVTYAPANSATRMLAATGLTTFSSFTGLKSTTPPVNQELANISIPNGVNNCYDATQVLTVAGNGNTFVVENGGSVTLVAGNRISVLPGTRVFAGGYLYAHITTDGTYCGSAKNPLVATLESVNSPEIEPVIENQFIKVYPNPTTNIVIVELLENSSAAAASITVYNMNGSILFRKPVKGDSKFQFSLSGKPVGMYMVHVQSGERSEIAKIIKN